MGLQRVRHDWATFTLTYNKMTKKKRIKWWRGKTYNQEHSTQEDSPSDLMEKSRLSRQTKVKRIQHHQTSFTTYAKGTSIGKKHKRRKRPTENKPQTVKKTVIESYISIITLNVNGLSAPTKDIDWLGRWKHVHICISTLPHQSV